MKKMFIRDIRSGDRVDDIFVLSEKTMGQKKDGNNFLNIAIADKTGTIKGVVWDDVNQTASMARAGDFVHLRGHVSEYRDALQLVVKKMAPVNADLVDPSDFLPATERNVDQMFQRIVALTDTMAKGHLKLLLDTFWNDADFVKQFKTAPAAKKMHHAYIGGLLEHTLSVALLVDRIAGHYSGIDMDLLLAGAILHDIGKIREFEYSHCLDYSSEGRLLSHIVIGVQIIEEKIGLVENFPEDLALLLKHLVVSHHGSREFGSPEVPKTIEAVLLNYIDEIDSKVTGIRNFMAAEDPNEPWTGYHRLLGRHFFKRSFSAARDL
ncbi:MAG: hypothetical protein B6I22_02685 [Desulfobacteraceae bacterium 4572_123]|nr:MAG: hypothetical protein B6I22_02685 [Desulfobacteraceae bacterium 4572_123]